MRDVERKPWMMPRAGILRVARWNRRKRESGSVLPKKEDVEGVDVALSEGFDGEEEKGNEGDHGFGQW
jgi:hypothetical protein